MVFDTSAEVSFLFLVQSIKCYFIFDRSVPVESMC